uniref:Uncharacterized protein n=1 Tax=viral metagenome TaxID=1070528 RepID=A0A6M3JLE8_9ZZZZ
MPRGVYERNPNRNYGKGYKHRPGLKREPGAGRPTLYAGFETTRIKFTLPVEFVEYLDEQAKAQKTTRAFVLHSMLFEEA